MNEESKQAGDFVFEISVNDVLRSCGIQLAQWQHDLLYTDAAFGTGWLQENCDRMAALSLMCAYFLHERKEVPRDVMVGMPDDVGGVVSVNPFYDGDTTKPALDGEGDGVDLGDDLPF